MMRRLWNSIFVLTLIFAGSGAWAVPAQALDHAAQEKAKQIWQVLDYLAVDYGKAVQNGQIVSKDEYAEMEEFAQAAQRQIGGLPDSAQRAQLLRQASELSALIKAKGANQAVAEHARSLAGALLAAYPVPMAPNKVPDLKQGARLYQQECASCHGAKGHGDGPLAAKLNPPPIALSDHKRARERSVFSLQQIITNGVEGTAMPGFSKLTEDERWALAYFASTLSYTDEERRLGKQLWASEPSLHNAVPNLSDLSQASEAALAAKTPDGNARALLAYLREDPAAVSTSDTDSLGLAKRRLTESVQALEQGNRTEASRLALSAYLDGFEIAEPALAAKNKALFEELERSMGAFRTTVNNGQLENARTQEAQLQKLLGEAQSAVAAGAEDPVSTFFGAFTILLREGVEALLLIVAMVAFLKKAGRNDVLPYVHAGWIAALAAGGLTWAVATYAVNLSGASREMTEGFSAVFAAVVLLAVGIWMHQKSMAGRWQAYIKEKLSGALTRRSAPVLFVLSFLTVYREVFETVLFYVALWSAGNGIYMLAGLVSAIIVLAAIAAVLLRTSARLPFGKFFAASSALVALLAFILIGKGVAALQKAGLFEMTPLALPQIDLLGIYPSLQTILAQVLILFVIVASVAFNSRSQKTH